MNKIEHIVLGGTDQYFGVYGKSLDNPLVLYLHGGPADSCIPLIEKYNLSLAANMTLIVLEQRGAGLSYYKFSQDENLSIQTFIDDIHEFVLFLLNKFNKQKLSIIAHSWGSVLGIKFIQAYPHLVEKYIGCGQVVNMKKNLDLQISYVISQTNNSQVLNRIDNIKHELESENWIEALLYLTKLVGKFGGSLYGKTGMNSLIPPFLFSKKYSITNLINRQKGSLQGIEYFWKELMEVDFTDITCFDVPVTFIEGQHDFHVSSKLAYDWYCTITSEKKFYYFEKSSHFPQWEEPTKFNSLISNLVK